MASGCLFLGCTAVIAGNFDRAPVWQGLGSCWTGLPFSPKGDAVSKSIYLAKHKGSGPERTIPGCCLERAVCVCQGLSAVELATLSHVVTEMQILEPDVQVDASHSSALMTVVCFVSHVTLSVIGRV